MARFSYTAVNKAGRQVRGDMNADNDMDLEARLKQMDLDLVSSRQLRERRMLRFGSVRVRDLIVLCLHLEQLDRAGVPLLDSLADMRDTADTPRMKDLLIGIFESVKNGKMLSVALAEHPKVFGTVFVGLVAAGEKTGKLADSFGHLGRHLKWTSELKRKVKKAIRYPIAVLFFITLAITILMTMVVPKLISFILNQGFSIPWHTKALIAVSHAFEHYWYLIFGIPAGIIILFIIIYRKFPNVAYKADTVFLKLPVMGPVIRKIDMARFTHFFAIMFNSGVDILEALGGAQKVVRNRVLKESVDEVRQAVTNGSSITKALKQSGQFPNLVVRMFKVGEDSGNMKDALENVNFFYDREVNDSVEAMVGMIQPALTVVLGLILFWVIAAMFGPLYESFTKMKM